MSTIAVGGGLSRSAAFYQSVVGKKILMAVTGFILLGFVLGHMAGNLQLFLPVDAETGRHPLDLYAEKLRALPALLWGARLVLLASVLLHILTATQLALLNKFEARPVAYIRKASVGSSYASRTMLWSGPIVGAFIVYHLLHLTIGAAHQDFNAALVYRNVVLGLSDPAVALFYAVANILLAIHLQHGVWSMFQTIGVAHPRYTPLLKRVSVVFALLVGLGNCSMPLAVLAGLVKL